MLRSLQVSAGSFPTNMDPELVFRRGQHLSKWNTICVLSLSELGDSYCFGEAQAADPYPFLKPKLPTCSCPPSSPGSPFGITCRFPFCKTQVHSSAKVTPEMIHQSGAFQKALRSPVPREDQGRHFNILQKSSTPSPATWVVRIEVTWGSKYLLADSPKKDMYFRLAT